MRYGLVVTLCCGVLSLPGWTLAAPAVIGTQVIGQSGASPVSSLSVSATCPSGNTNVIAVACLATHKNGNTLTGSATWNSVTMTAGTAAIEGTVNGAYAQLFTLTNPTCDGAAHNVVLSITGGSSWLVGGILFLKDVNATTPHDGIENATSAAGTQLTQNVDSAVDDLVVDCALVKDSTINMSLGAGQSGLFTETTSGTAAANVEGGQSYEAGAAPTVTMQWASSTGSPTWASTAASFNPVAVVGRRRFVPPRQLLRFFDDWSPLLVGDRVVAFQERRSLMKKRVWADPPADPPVPEPPAPQPPDEPEK